MKIVISVMEIVMLRKGTTVARIGFILSGMEFILGCVEFVPWKPKTALSWLNAEPTVRFHSSRRATAG